MIVAAKCDARNLVHLLRTPFASPTDVSAGKDGPALSEAGEVT